MNNIKMLYYDRIDVSEGIDINKEKALKECDICHYWYFLNKGFSFNHMYAIYNLSDIAYEPHDIAILKIKNTNYCFIITGITTYFYYYWKSEAIKLLQKIDLTEKSGTL